MLVQFEFKRAPAFERTGRSRPLDRGHAVPLRLRLERHSAGETLPVAAATCRSSCRVSLDVAAGAVPRVRCASPSTHAQSHASQLTHGVAARAKPLLRRCIFQRACAHAALHACAKCALLPRWRAPPTPPHCTGHRARVRHAVAASTVPLNERDDTMLELLALLPRLPGREASFRLRCTTKGSPAR